MDNFDLNPAIFYRKGARDPIDRARANHRDLWHEIKVSIGDARTVVADTRETRCIFELMANFPTRDILLFGNSRLKLIRSPEFQRLLQLRSLPDLSSDGAQQMKELPTDTLGYRYACFVERRGLKDTFLDYLPTPDNVIPYYTYRMVLLHDLFHFLLGYEPYDPVAEMQVESFLLAQTHGWNNVLFLAGYTANFVKGKRDKLRQARVPIQEAYAYGKRAVNLVLTEWQRYLARPLEQVRIELRLTERPVCE